MKVENLGMIFPQVVENSEFSEFFSEFFQARIEIPGSFCRLFFVFHGSFPQGVLKLKNFVIPWFSLNFLLFYYPGGRTHGSGAAKGFSPSAPPFSSFGYAKICSLWRTRALNTDKRQCSSIYLLKNGIQRILNFSEQP